MFGAKKTSSWLVAAMLGLLTSMAAAAPKARAPLKTPASDSTPRKPECQELRWKGSQEKELLQEQLAFVPRANLIQIAWGESLSDPATSVASVILFYLQANETHRPLKAYYQSIADEIGGGKFTLRGLSARYPIRKGNLKVARKLEELCQAYDVAYLEKDTLPVPDFQRGPQR